VDIQSFDYIAAMDPAVLDFLRHAGVVPPQVKETYVDDPIGGDTRQYEECAHAIDSKLVALVF
jgi:hypothetical protein